jgi:plastocyanin
MKWIIGIVVIILLAFGVYALMNQSPAATTGSNPPTDTGASPVTTGDDQNPTTGSGPTTGATQMVVQYTNSGFVPSSLNVSVGQSVTFVNKSSGQMWVASDPHPTHQGYDGTTESVHCAAGYAGAAPFDECKSADSFTFIFTKQGSWGYHNHFSSSAHGTIVVAPGTSTTN